MFSSFFSLGGWPFSPYPRTVQWIFCWFPHLSPPLDSQEQHNYFLTVISTTIYFIPSVHHYHASEENPPCSYTARRRTNTVSSSQQEISLQEFSGTHTSSTHTLFSQHSNWTAVCSALTLDTPPRASNTLSSWTASAQKQIYHDVENEYDHDNKNDEVKDDNENQYDDDRKLPAKNWKVLIKTTAMTRMTFIQNWRQLWHLWQQLERSK